MKDRKEKAQGNGGGSGGSGAPGGVPGGGTGVVPVSTPGTGTKVPSKRRKNLGEMCTELGISCGKRERQMVDVAGKTATRSQRRKAASVLLKLARRIIGAQPVRVTEAAIKIGGPEASQYWGGCVGIKGYEHTASGAGLSEYEAYEDALENMFQQHDIDERRSKRALGGLSRGLSKREDIEEKALDWISDSDIERNLDLRRSDFDTAEDYEEAKRDEWSDAQDAAVAEAVEDTYYYACISYNLEAVEER